MSQLFPIEIKKHVYLRSVDSTNLYALNHASNFKPQHNFSVYSFLQTNGRGQIGRFWYSGESQNISLSYFVRLNLPSKIHFRLNMAFSLAIYEFLLSHIPDKDVKIKWPNDIYVGSRKIAGILIQNTLRGMTLVNSVLGIGININQKAFPPDIPNPTSLLLETGKHYNLITLTSRVHKFVEKRLSELASSDEVLLKEYISSMYALNTNQTFQDEHGLFEGVITGVTEEGKLMVKTAEKIKTYNFREVNYIIK